MHLVESVIVKNYRKHHFHYEFYFSIVDILGFILPALNLAVNLEYMRKERCTGFTEFVRLVFSNACTWAFSVGAAIIQHLKLSSLCKLLLTDITFVS